MSEPTSFEELLDVYRAKLESCCLADFELDDENDAEELEAQKEMHAAEEKARAALVEHNAKLEAKSERLVEALEKIKDVITNDADWCYRVAKEALEESQ